MNIVHEQCPNSTESKNRLGAPSAQPAGQLAHLGVHRLAQVRARGRVIAWPPSRVAAQGLPCCGCPAPCHSAQGAV